MLGWHPTLFQAALGASVVAYLGFFVLVGKALKLMDEGDRAAQAADALDQLVGHAEPLPGFTVIPEPPFDWTVDA